MAVEQQLTLAVVQQLAKQLDEASRTAKPDAICGPLPADLLGDYLKAGFEAFKDQPTVLDLDLTDPEVKVAVVGDTHGQFHDVLGMLLKYGWPSEKLVYVFNGDYVDRGAWGVELFALLLCLKLAVPQHIHLLRGNHESSMCTKFYGFFGELKAKYGARCKDIYPACKKVFSQLPLACVIQKSTLVVHGGLFRAPHDRHRGAKRRKVSLNRALAVGSLDDLRKAPKGGLDPDGRGASLLATDVLWSDPVAEPGLRENDARGVGLVFGPDITQSFLEANGLKLIIRSHEGPDARDKRSDLPQVLAGYAWDHNTPAGKLLTVFSAPDYPQFIEEGTARYNNLAAVAVLSAPCYSQPEMCSFEAVRPRPHATAYYDYNVYVCSDDELPAGGSDDEPEASTGPGASSAAAAMGGDTAATGASGAGAQEEVLGAAAHMAGLAGHGAEQPQALAAAQGAAGVGAADGDVHVSAAAGAAAAAAAAALGPAAAPGASMAPAAGAPCTPSAPVGLAEEAAEGPVLTTSGADALQAPSTRDGVQPAAGALGPAALRGAGEAGAEGAAPSEDPGDGALGCGAAAQMDPSPEREAAVGTAGLHAEAAPTVGVAAAVCRAGDTEASTPCEPAAEAPEAAVGAVP